MSEATLHKDADTIDVTTPTAGYASGEVIQLSDGRAAVVSGLLAKTSGDPAALKSGGQFTLTKGTSLVILEGAPLYWDRSAGSVTPLKAVAGGNFFVGVAVVDAAAADTTVVVDLNKRPHYTIDLARTPFESIPVGAATLTMMPGCAKFNILATSEAEKIDAFSEHSVPVVAGAAIPFIVEGRMASYVIGTDNTVDMNVGIADATHASNADTIAESVFLHLDEVLDIFAESDDGSAEESEDTLVDCVDNVYFDFAFDCRDLTDIKIYINGVRVLAATTFKLNAATGPIKLAVHVEKTTGSATGELRVSKLALRCTDLAS